MKINKIEIPKKLYNKLDYFTDGLINRIIALYGLNIIIISIYCLTVASGEMKWFLSAIFTIPSIPIGIGYIIIKLISIPITLKFKIPAININIYLIAGILFSIICYTTISKSIELILTITGFTALTILILKTPFLPNCKLKTFQEKLEKNVIKISFIAFFICFSTLTMQLLCHFLTTSFNS